MKKFINKNILFGFIIGLLVMGIAGVSAATLYYSNEVSYTPSDTSWNVDNVEKALNALYEITGELETLKSLGDATADDIAVGKTAVVNGKLITGNKGADYTYHYKLGGSVWSNNNADASGTTTFNIGAPIKYGTLVLYSCNGPGYPSNIEYVIKIENGIASNMNNNAKIYGYIGNTGGLKYYFISAISYDSTTGDMTLTKSTGFYGTMGWEVYGFY